jgi:hypothetical protein
MYRCEKQILNANHKKPLAQKNNTKIITVFKNVTLSLSELAVKTTVFTWLMEIAVKILRWLNSWF